MGKNNTTSNGIQKSFFILSSMSVGVAKARASMLLHYGERAMISRDEARMQQVAHLIRQVPGLERSPIATYLQALVDKDRAIEMLESVTECESFDHRARILLSLASRKLLKGDVNSANQIYEKALKDIRRLGNHALHAYTLKNQSVILSLLGEHKNATRIIESVLPTANRMEPAFYLDLLNSYAVELGEAGRIEEARRVIALPLASPLVVRFPEWIETAREIEEKIPRRNLITAPPRPLDNVVNITEYIESKSMSIADNHPCDLDGLRDDIQLTIRHLIRGGGRDDYSKLSLARRVLLENMSASDIAALHKILDQIALKNHPSKDNS